MQKNKNKFGKMELMCTWATAQVAPPAGDDAVQRAYGWLERGIGKTLIF
jgi:hypothetical protein